MINHATITILQAVYSTDELFRLAAMAAKVDHLEARWRTRVKSAYGRAGLVMIESLEDHGRITKVAQEEVEQILTQVFMEHALDVMVASFKSAVRMPVVPKRLAAIPKGRTPRSLAELRKQWDMWRKRGEVPPRQQAIVTNVKRAYIKKCQDVWERHSEGYRKGGPQDKAYVVAKMKEAAETQYSRGKMIVETETTRYWNQTRRQVYDEAEDVTHYLFVPIRDMATTKWCNSRRGLVYKKGDPLLDKETPPIHWNCRSEILPLTIMNPAHRKMIEDKSRERRRHKCEPLPPGWNS